MLSIRALVFPLVAIPFAHVGQPIAPPRAPIGFVVTMEYSDAASTSTFSVKVMGDKFRVELGEMIPLMGKILGGGAGTNDAMTTLGNIGQMAAGAYMFSQDSGKLAVVLPAAGIATAIDPSVVAGAMQGRGRNNAGNGGGYNGGGGGGGGGRRGGGGAAGDTTNGNGRPRGRGGRGAPPDSNNARGGRRGRAAQDTTPSITVTVNDLGPGERLLGHATRKFRIHVSAPVSVGGTCAGTNSEEVTTSAWFATDVPDGGFTSVFSFIPVLLGGGAVPQGPDPFGGKMPHGMPMKLAAVCDNSHESLGTLQATNIEQTSFESGEFDIPQGIQLVDPNANQRRGRRGGGH